MNVFSTSKLNLRMCIHLFYHYVCYVRVVRRILEVVTVMEGPPRIWECRDFRDTCSTSLEAFVTPSCAFHSFKPPVNRTRPDVPSGTDCNSSWSNVCLMPIHKDTLYKFCTYMVYVAGWSRLKYFIKSSGNFQRA